MFTKFAVLFSLSLWTLLSPVVWCVSRVTGRSEVQTQTNEKESRTPEQKKIDSQLLYAIYQMRGEAEAKGVPTEEIKLRKDSKGRVLVDIRSVVTSNLVSIVKKTGAKIVSISQRDDSLVAYVPLNQLERIARVKEVRFISQPSEAITH
jgi:hypothetical protein